MDHNIKRYLLESIKSGRENIIRWRNYIRYDKLFPNQKEAFLTFLFFEFDIYPNQQLIYYKISNMYEAICLPYYDNINIELSEKIKFNNNRKLMREKLSHIIYDDIQESNQTSVLFTKPCSNNNLILELKAKLTRDELHSLIQVLSYINGINIAYIIEFFYYILAIYLINCQTKDIAYNVTSLGATNLQYYCIKHIVIKHKDKIELISDMLPKEIICDIKSYISFLKP